MCSPLTASCLDIPMAFHGSSLCVFSPLLSIFKHRDLGYFAKTQVSMYHWFGPQHILNLHFVVVVIVAVPCPETPSSDVTPEGKYVVGPPYTLTPGSHPGFPSYLCNDSHPFLSISLTQAYAVFNIYSSCLNSAFPNGIQTTERQRFVVVSSIIS